MAAISSSCVAQIVCRLSDAFGVLIERRDIDLRGEVTAHTQELRHLRQRQRADFVAALQPLQADLQPTGRMPRKRYSVAARRRVWCSSLGAPPPCPVRLLRE
jgi:hypothetical protein